MGKKDKSSKTSKTSKVPEYLVPEPVLVTIPRKGRDPYELPFRPWSDQELNAEKWEPPKDKKAKDASPDKGPAKFEDPQVVHLPHSIAAYEWKRPAEVFPEVQFIIYAEKPIYPDLISGSKHLLQSEFVRSFISSVATLLYLGNTGQFTIEYPSPLYTPTTAEDPWRPWHHIYSNCKAGKGKEHEPTVNNMGKYVVRLFWMGSWRKIYVDDLLPVDLLNHVLLPSLELTKEELEKIALAKDLAGETPPPPPPPSADPKKKPTPAKKKAPEIKFVELWPFLLSKALLKIASLSWYDEKEILDFDIIQCFTGWVPQKLNTKGFAISEIWEICSAYTNHFCWPPDKSEAGTKSSKASKGKGKKSGAVTEKDSAANAHHLLACCNDLRTFAEDEISDITPCWSHYFLIDQSRDIPLLKPTLTADLAFWKRFRWLAYMVEKGLVPAEEMLEQIRCFKLISPFKKVYEHVSYKQPSKIAIIIEKSVQIITDLKDKGKKGKGKDKGKDKDKSKSSKASSSKPSSSSKGSKGSKKGKKKKIDVSQIPNPSIWVDYEKLSYQINHIIIYLKPSKFKSKINITDLATNVGGKEAKPQKPKKGADAGDEWKTFIKTVDTQECRNEPIYIFSESVDYKLIVVNMLQTGYAPILIRETIEEPNVEDDIRECEFCVASLVKRVKRNITKVEQKQYRPLPELKPETVDHVRPLSHLVVENFDWRTDKSGDMISTINTYGAKATILDLPPGRQLLKLWIKSDTPYVVHVLSDTTVVAGYLEAVLFSMSQESQLLVDTCLEVASNFGKLVQAFGMPEYAIHLRAFYSSYKPLTHLTEHECTIVHDTFYGLLHDTVERCLTEKELKAFKILLLKFDLPPNTDDEVLKYCNCYDDDEDFEFVKVMERYAVHVQAFFRGIYQRCLMKYHKPTHKFYMATFDSLKLVYNTIFAAAKRLTTGPELFRHFFDHPDMSDIKTKYRVYRDLENVLTLQEIIQSVKMPENEWGLICRHQFFVNCPEAIIIKINLFCDLRRYFVRVFDNDSAVEIRRFTNNATVHSYSPNVNGYTLLCHGWSEEAKQLPFKLSFAFKKDIVQNKLIIMQVPAESEFIIGNYIPNVNNFICKYLVHIFSDNVLLSTRFATSMEDATVTLRIYNDYGILLREVTGKKNILLPVIVLEYQPKNETKTESCSSIRDSLREKRLSIKTNSSRSIGASKKKSDISSLKSSTNSRRESNTSSKSVEEDQGTMYLIEATIVDDSWPLTAQEWSVVEGLKSEMLYRANMAETSSLDRKGSMRKSSDSLKRRSSSRRSDSLLNRPYWMMQIMYNSGDLVQFAKDQRREEEIRDIKSKWYEPDPARYDTSQELRQIYLEENRIPNYYMPCDVDGIRSLDANLFASEVFPPYDLSEFMLPDPEEFDERTRKIKNDAALLVEYLVELVLLEESELQHQRNIEKMDNYLLDQMNYFEVVNNWFEGCRQESSEMIEFALCLKAQYITGVLEKLKAESAPKSDKGDKKKAKGKGKKK